MLAIYDHTLKKFKKNMRNHGPIILALFTGDGGQMILYRPGHPPEVAPPVPIVYQLAKSIGHSTMAIYEIVAPYLANPTANLRWWGPLTTYRTPKWNGPGWPGRPGHLRGRAGSSSAPFSNATWPSWTNA